MPSARRFSGAVTSPCGPIPSCRCLDFRSISTRCPNSSTPTATRYCSLTGRGRHTCLFGTSCSAKKSGAGSGWSINRGNDSATSSRFAGRHAVVDQHVRHVVRTVEEQLHPGLADVLRDGHERIAEFGGFEVRETADADEELRQHQVEAAVVEDRPGVADDFQPAVPTRPAELPRSSRDPLPRHDDEPARVAPDQAPRTHPCRARR